MVMSSPPSDQEYSLRRVQIYADQLLKMEIMVWSANDEEAVGLACRAAREVLRALPKRPQDKQRYSSGLRGVVEQDQNNTPEDYNGVADPLQSPH